MPALYRQYRPQFFREVSGQEHITNTLLQALQKEKVAHAYLFQGPRGTGKTTSARIFAKGLNCSDRKKGEPCGKCATCVATQDQRNIDIIEIDAASNRGIDDIRTLRENVGLSPSMGTYKVYIIDEVHMLTNEAFAALLKTLEEPVKHAIFILATTELHKVPETILSRCQVFRFRRASDAEMKARLAFLLSEEKRSADDTVLDFITRRSDGCYRDAESLLGQLLTSDDKNLTLESMVDFLGLPPPTLLHDFLQSLVTSNVKDAMILAEKAYIEGYDPEQFIQESIRLARDAVVSLAKGSSENLPSFATQPQAQQRLPQIIRAFIQATQDMAYVPQPLIAIELAIMSVCIAAPAPIQATAPPAQPVRQPKPTSLPQPLIQKPQPTPVVSQQVLQKKEPAPVTSGVVTVEQVSHVWPQLIDTIRSNNPVSSTFLRATNPSSVNGSVVILKAQFPLHRNFLEKPENKKLVEEELSKLLKEMVSIQCVLDENGRSFTEVRQESQQKEDEVFNNVKEVFGIR